MAGVSDFAELAILNAVGNNTSFVVAQAYIKLHVNDPGDAGTLNAAGNTTRKSVSFAVAAAGAMSSDADLTWTSVSNTEDYTHFSLWDTIGPAGGNCLWTGTITANAVTAGDTFTIASGNLTLTLD